MASRRGSSGLSIGQLFTLTFGFLLASIAIFVFGLWVGRDLATRRQQSDGEVMRIAVDPTPTAGQAAVAPPVGEVAEAPPAATASHTPPPTALPERSATPRPTTPALPTPPPRSTPTAGREVVDNAAARWTIQVTATNDQVQALVQAQRLRSQGFDAYTVQTEIGGSTWYRVQAGKYTQRAKAQADAQRLRAKGFEAAFVSELR